jgi:RNA polymerase sigma factor (sigma-70 family)
LAEDLLADTFERALRARRRFNRARASEKKWLYTIALNCLHDQRRRASAEARALERLARGTCAPVSGDLELAVAERDALGRALGTLSDDEREVIALRFGGDLSVPEIAKLTKQRLSTTEGRLYRALRKLDRELQVHGG